MTQPYSPLASPRATRHVLEQHGLMPKKAFGQNFLIDDNVVGRILELAALSPDDLVVEVGPGIGTLTSALLSVCAGVVAIERDASLVPVLADTLAHDADRLRLVQKDALAVERVDVAFGSHETGHLFPHALISNLPYAVAATIVLDYFQRFDFLTSMTVMVQKEVAQRMAAQAGTKNYGAYTVKLSLYAHVVGSFDVPRSCFLPAPHVDSTVIRLDRRDSYVAHDDAALTEAACLMADAAFFARRKTIANSCKRFFAGRSELDEGRIGDVLAAAGVDPACRGESLSTDDFVALGRALRAL